MHRNSLGPHLAKSARPNPAHIHLTQGYRLSSSQYSVPWALVWLPAPSSHSGTEVGGEWLYSGIMLEDLCYSVVGKVSGWRVRPRGRFVLFIWKIRRCGKTTADKLTHRTLFLAIHLLRNTDVKTFNCMKSQ